MWSSLIFLSLVFTQIYGQGFQLVFGTTAGITECKDKLPNCFAFGKDSCKAPYEKWANDYCPNTCGFCVGPTTPEPPCENQRADCESYQKTVCTDQRYAQWANDNCRYYCRLCSAQKLAEKDSHITTIPPALCVDKLDDCKLYGKDSCKGQYASWAKENCRRYCGFCIGAPTPAPPCRDKIPSCSQYQKDTCTDSKYRGWAEENCNKYCGFCSGGSGPGNQPPTLSPVPTFSPGTGTNAPNIPHLPVGTLAPPLPGKRRAGIGSSAEAGGNVFFQPKAKQTPKPTPEPTTAAPTQAPTTPKPTTTTPMPTTTKPTPKPNKYALSVGSSATGNKDPNFIDFGNGSEVKSTEKPTTKKSGTESGTGSSAGGGTTEKPGTPQPATDATTNPPTKPVVTTQKVPTQAPVVTSGTATGPTKKTNGTDAGTGSGPNKQSKPPGSVTTAMPGGITAGMGSGTTAGMGSGTTAGSGQTGVTSNGTDAGTGSGPNNQSQKPGGATTTGPGGATSGGSGSNTGAATTQPPPTLRPNVNSVTLPDINKSDNYTDFNSTDGVCRNLINCRVYPPEKICTNGSIYQPWAKVRCRAYCGFCIQHTSPIPCVDKIPNCNEYDADLCTNPLYRLFREDNCRKFCSLCKVSTAGKRDYEEDHSSEFY